MQSHVKFSKNYEKLFKTYDEFWNLKLSNKLLKEKNEIDLIFSANISHIPNLEETFKGINKVLSKDGVLVIEDPSLLKVLKNNSYDQFYDEHVDVFSTLSVKNIVKKFGLRLILEHLSTHEALIVITYVRKMENTKVAQD